MIIDPLLRKQLHRFRRNRRAFWSFALVAGAFLLSLGSEIICNNLPYVMRFEGQWYFPIAKFYPASTFGEEVQLETDYKALRTTERFKKPGNWMLLPPVPYSPSESMLDLPGPPPTRPSSKNFLGTDDRGRDLLTRLIYGFRNSMLFALISWVLIVILGYLTGAIQGYLGGRIDFLGQRLIEIWNALPVLYVIIFLISLFPANLTLLIIVWVGFSWMALSSYVRVEALRVRKLDYVVAAQGLGARLPRILIRHILPNTLTPIVTLSPFIISSSIFALASLDYLGLGLPPPTPSWGELLHQGKENFNAWWIGVFSFLSLFGTMLLFNFIGEGVRSAFDARE